MLQYLMNEIVALKASLESLALIQSCRSKTESA